MIEMKDVAQVLTVFAVALVAFFVVSSGWRRSRSDSAGRDEIPASRAIRHMVNSSWGWQRIGAGEDVQLVEDAAVEKLVQAAREGQITIRGCRKPIIDVKAEAQGPRQDAARLQVLGPDFWQGSTIALRSVVRPAPNDGGETRPLAGAEAADGEAPPVYDRLRVSRSQLHRLYPPSNVFVREWHRLRLTRDRLRNSSEC